MLCFENLPIGTKFVFEYEIRWYFEELVPKRQQFKNKHMPILNSFIKTGQDTYESSPVDTLFDNRINRGSKLPKIKGYVIPTNTEVYLLDEFLQSKTYRAYRKRMSET